MRKVSILILLLLLLNSSISFAQDAKSGIVYTRLTDGIWQIWLKEFPGEAKPLTISAFDKRTPVWSPDGKKILYRSNNRELFAFNLETKEEQQILSNLGWITDPSFVNNQKIIFSRFDQNLKDESDLWMSDVEGKNPQLITKRPGLEYSPQMSPDGKRILFSAGQGYGNHELFTLELDTKKESELTKNRALELHPVWSKDAKEIVYASDESGNFEIYAMNLETHETSRLTDLPGADLYPSWSPDGKQIAFVSDRSGLLQIWVMDRDGKNQRILIEDKAPAQEPCWR